MTPSWIDLLKFALLVALGAGVALAAHWIKEKMKP